MAPESILDLVYNEKTDVWSFGIVCWEILSKSEPYPDLDPVQGN
jgi:serine/threonine protein kinase